MARDSNNLGWNIYYMLTYTFRALRFSNFENLATEKFENVQNLFAAILSRGIGQQLKQGLYREYIEQTEDLPVMRGKINMVGTIRNRIAHRQLLTCEYDELSENNLYNQILKTTVMLLLHDDRVKDDHKDILRKEMFYFSNVEEIDPTTIPWSRVRYHRNNQTYSTLIRICEMTLKGLLLTNRRGDYRLRTFLNDQEMWRLYENFLRCYYQQEFPQLNVAARQIEWAGVERKAGTMLPKMQSDIMISYQDKVLIIDAKCYTNITTEHYDVPKLHSGNVYQIYAYVKNEFDNRNMGKAPEEKKTEVSGMLLYAQTDERVLPNESSNINGNRIDARSLDLYQDFKGIKAQLDGIAKEFFPEIFSEAKQQG